MNMMIDMAENTRDGIARELHAWHTTGLRIAIWGSGGELAAFLETYGLDAHRFPTIVDSDPAQAGTFVPGIGQVIRSPDWLLDNPVDIILIPCPGRPPISFARSTQHESPTKASSSRTRATSSITTPPK